PSDIAPRISYPVSDFAAEAMRRSNIAILAAPDSTDPAFDTDFFSGLVHPSIVEDVPAQEVVSGPPEPCAVIGPPGLVLGHYCDIAPPAATRHRLFGSSALPRREGNARYAVAPSGSFRARRQKGQIDALERLAIFQRGCPADQLAAIYVSVQSDRCGLDPGNHRLLAIALCSGRSQRLDDHCNPPMAAREGRAQD